MVLLRKGQAVNLCIFIQFIVWLLSVVGFSTSTQGQEENQYKCIALRFMNHVGSNFRIISTMKPEGYPVTTDEYKLKTIFRHSQLRHFVIFHGADDENKKEILLDGEQTISVSPQADCENFADVIVTAREAPVRKEEAAFSETNLLPDSPPSSIKKVPSNSKKISPTELENKNGSPKQIRSAHKKGEIYDQNKHDEKKYPDIPMLSDSDTNTMIYKPRNSLLLTNKQRNTKRLEILTKHLFTTNDDDDTNMTYVDEDLPDNDAMFNYHPITKEKSAPLTHRVEKSGENAKSRKKSLGKYEYSEEVKLLKKMLPLLAKYNSLKLDEDSKNTDIPSRSEQILFSDRNNRSKLDKNFQRLSDDKRLTSVENSKNGREYGQSVYPATFSKLKERRKDDFHVNIESPKINRKHNTRNMNAAGLNHAAQNAILNTQKGKDLRVPKESKLASSKNINIQKSPNIKDSNILQTTLHHTKLTTKDGTVEIINRLPDNPSDNSTVTKPKVIQSKAKAIGEIFKALGSNNKIVKDANGLYLISGKHVKIIHSTHGKGAREKNIQNPKGENKEQIQLSNIETDNRISLKASRVRLNQSELMKSHNFAPVLHIRSKNLDTNQENGMKKKLGLALSSYNLKDLKQKLQVNVQSTSKFSNNFNKTSEDAAGHKSVLDNIDNEDSEVNNGMLSLKERNDSYTNVENINDKQSKKNTNDAFNRNSKVAWYVDRKPLESQNLPQDIKKQDSNRINFTSTFMEDDKHVNKHFSSYLTSNMTFTLANASRVSGKSINRDMPNELGRELSLGRGFLPESDLSGVRKRNASRASGDRVNDNFSDEEDQSNLTDLPVEKNTQTLPTKVDLSEVDLSRNTKKEAFPRNKQESFHEKSIKKFLERQEKANSTDEKLSDVRIEVIDEAKENNTKPDQTTTEIKQDTEDIEIIDEGKASQPAMKITPQDISSALQEKFGKKGPDGVMSDNWGLEETKSTEIKRATGRGESRLGTPSGSTGSVKVLGVVGRPQAGTLTRYKKLGKDQNGGLQNWEPFSKDHQTNLSKGLHQVANKKPLNKETKRIQSDLGNTIETYGSNEGDTGKTGDNESSQGIFRINMDQLGTSKDNRGMQGTIRKTEGLQSNNKNLLGMNTGNEDPEKISKGHHGELGTTNITNGSGEAMIPKRIVDALLSSITKDFKERLYEKNSDNNRLKNKALKNSASKTFQDIENKITTSVGDRITKVNKQKVRPSRILEAKATSTAEDTDLNNLLEKFVSLLSTRIKTIKTDKPKKKMKPRKEYEIQSTIPMLKYQEKLLGEQQQKLEHQLALEKKLLEESKLKEKENIKTSKPFPTKSEDKDELAKRIRELNTKKNCLLKKLKLLSFQEKYKTIRDDPNGDRLMKNDREIRIRENYGRPSQSTDTAPYMGTNVGYKVINDRRFNKQSESVSGLKEADEQLRQKLAEYEPTMGSSNGEIAEASESIGSTPIDSDGHTSETSVSGEHLMQPLQQETAMGIHEHPTTEVNDTPTESDGHEMVPLGKAFTEPELNTNTSPKLGNVENTPRNTADQLQNTKGMTADASEDEEYPIYPHTPPYHQTQVEPYRYTTNPTTTTRILSYPTPSFITQEADYASNAAEKFVDPFRQSTPVYDSNFKNLVQNSMKDSKPDYPGYTKSLNQASRSSQGIQRVRDVFPGTYSYGEDPTVHENTRSLSHWRQEDANLLKEMPEYSAKDNTIESSTLPGHYNVFTTEKDSTAETTPQVLNIPGSAGNDNTRVQEFRTENERLNQPIGSKVEDITSKAYSQPSIIMGLKENREVPGNKKLQQLMPSALQSTGSMVYSQTTDIVGSNNEERERGNELHNAQVDNIVSQFNKERIKFGYEDAESQQLAANQIDDVNSNIQTEHYNTLTSGQESDKLNPQVTNIVGTDDSDEDYPLEKSQQSIGDEANSAFEIVEGGEVPTLRRNTDDPEDGVRDRTYINGDEYHLQKKYRIAKKDSSKHV